ncbi:nitroreductase family protein [Paenibacillus sp. PCH8]|uniref:nitroreductase family protein n=1 Tax=Paenibacillus sp. PCH8 TaxID=2066524 RepID=UPI002157B6D6|nr:nitroreductase family protein [Paenibacillus sp. PCH8]
MIEMSPVAQAIMEHRAIRRFKSDPVPQEVLAFLQNTANWAPNHGLREPWRYIQFSDAFREQFTEDRRGYEESRRAEYAVIQLHLVVVMRKIHGQSNGSKILVRCAAGFKVFNLQLGSRLGVVWKTNTFLLPRTSVR